MLLTLQAGSTIVGQGGGEPGQLVIASDRADSNPVAIYNHGEEPAFLIPLRVAKALWWEDAEGRLQRAESDAAVPPGVWPRVLYNLLFCVPAYSSSMPVMCEMRGTAVDAAKVVITAHLMEDQLPLWAHMFMYTNARLRNDHGAWFKPSLRKVAKPKDEYLRTAAAMAVKLGLASNGDVLPPAETSEPEAIEPQSTTASPPVRRQRRDAGRARR